MKHEGLILHTENQCLHFWYLKYEDITAELRNNKSGSIKKEI